MKSKTEVKSKKDDIRQPPELGADPEDLETAEIVDGEPLEDARVLSGELSGKAIQRLIVRRAVIEAVSFAAADLRSVLLRDVRLIRCDLSNAAMRKFEASRVEFIDCRLTGLKALECRMEHVLLERCDARYAQFNGGALRSSDFVDSRLDESDFRAVNLEQTRWTRSNLCRADLTGAKLAGADLRGADIEGMVVGAQDVAGAIVSPGQAMNLARLLGLVVR